MAETRPKGLKLGAGEKLHVTFTLIYEHDGDAPDYADFRVSRGIPDGDKLKWEHDGIASFDAPRVALPVAGHELIPYFIYHNSLIRDWLTEEHVAGHMHGNTHMISAEVGLTADRPTLGVV